MDMPIENLIAVDSAHSIEFSGLISWKLAHTILRSEWLGECV